jgi:hypothetical protein
MERVLSPEDKTSRKGTMTTNKHRKKDCLFWESDRSGWVQVVSLKSSEFSGKVHNHLNSISSPAKWGLPRKLAVKTKYNGVAKFSAKLRLSEQLWLLLGFLLESLRTKPGSGEMRHCPGERLNVVRGKREFEAHGV